MENKKMHHVSILPSPGMGHIIPALALARKIISLKDFQVTLFITTTNSSTAQSQLLNSPTLTNGLRIIEIPPIDMSPLLPIDAGVETRISATIKASIPFLRSAISDMKEPPTALILDLFGTDICDLADELGMLKYFFSTTTATSTALIMYLPVLDKEIEGQYTDLQEPIQIPGIKRLEIENIFDPMLDRTRDNYHTILNHASVYSRTDGILINTCEEIEPDSVQSLKENPILKRAVSIPPIYPIGPLIRLPESSSSEDESLVWLDKQPSTSVLFVTFGSGGTLSYMQITELAWGLEQSKERFIWVLRAPSDKQNAAFFTSGSGGEDPRDYLPEGFLDRTKDVGFIVPSWCNQLEILKHDAIGACLSHCGWNSTLECIVHGLPMITWPLYAEQKLNASMIVEDIGVGIRPAVWATKEVIGRTEIEKMVRLIMTKEDEENPWRLKAKELKNKVLRALDEGGSSHNSLLEVAKQWKGE